MLTLIENSGMLLGMHSRISGVPTIAMARRLNLGLFTWLQEVMKEGTP